MPGLVSQSGDTEGTQTCVASEGPQDGGETGRCTTTLNLQVCTALGQERVGCD